MTKEKGTAICKAFLALVLALSVGLVVAPAGEVGADSQEFTSNSTFVVPVGVTQITVEAWGGGGAGGGSNNYTRCEGAGGGGGGGGAYASSTLNVTPGAILYVVVGRGGIPVGGGDGGAGEASFVGNGTDPAQAYVLAAGGSGGKANLGGGTPSGGAGGRREDSKGSIRHAGGDGGNGASGPLCLSGTGGNATNGGPGGLGFDGAENHDGYSGDLPGGGGGGARTSGQGGAHAGGAGGAGKVVITYTPAELYYLDTTVDPPGSGNATDLTGASPYPQGHVVNISASPYSGWAFVNWTAPAGSFADPYSANTTFTMPAQNVTVTAHFVSLVVYNLTTNSTDCGNVTTPGEGVYGHAAGTFVPLVASPDPGCQFLGWTATAGTFTNPSAAATYFIMPAENATVTARFGPIIIPPSPPCLPSYGLMIYSTEGGSVTRPGEGAFPYIGGYEVSLVATPDPGYRFVRWTGDVAMIANVYAAETTIHMDGWYVITANFEPLIVRYNLTTSSTSGGSVTSPGEGTFTYGDGAVVSLVASPDAGYQFVSWTGDVATVGNVNSASTTVTMHGNYAIVANFKEVAEYSLTVSSGPGGSVTNPGLGTFSYAAGSTVNLVAQSNTGYNFDSWTGHVATVANVNAARTTITMNGHYSIKANFKEATAGGPTTGTGGCFIATAAYGTPSAEQIEVLREFRDAVLLQNAVGSRFVSLYYRLSPPVADFIAGSDFLRTLVRETFIDPIVWAVQATGNMWRH